MTDDPAGASFDQVDANGRRANGTSADDEGSNGRPRGPSGRLKVLIWWSARLEAGEAGLMQDDEGVAYARVKDGAHFECFLVGSKTFRAWVQRGVMDRWPVEHDGVIYPGTVPRAALDEAIEIFHAQASRSPTVRPALRVGEDDGAIYINLANSEREVVKVTAEGWSIERREECPVCFVFKKSMRPMFRPERGGRIENFADLFGSMFVGEDGEKRLRLLLGTMTYFFSPTGPYPILNVQGEQGAGKSTLCGTIKRLVDPSSADRRSPPRDEKDLAIAASQGHLLNLDNLSGIPGDLADPLARISTGGAVAGRELYSNADEFVIRACAPVVLNGIPNLSNRADLIDRTVTIRLPAMVDQARKTEAEVNADLERAGPLVLGLLLDGLAAALASQDDVGELMRERGDQPRMLDFAVFAEAAADGFGWTRWQWLETYLGNRSDATEDLLEDDEFAVALLHFVKVRPSHAGFFDPKLTKEADRRGFDLDHHVWWGTCMDLLEDLEKWDEVKEKTKRSKAWPSSPMRISARLARMMTILRQHGLSVDRWKSGGKSGRRLIRLTWEPEPDER